jgi:hypothetical protein
MEKVPVYHIVDEEPEKQEKTPYGRFLYWKDVERHQFKERRIVEDRVYAHIQDAMHDALLEHVNWMQGKKENSPIPQDIVWDLLLCFREICLGFPHKYMTPVKKKGGKLGWRPEEEYCIEEAVTYLKYALKGAIKDKTPYKTIQNTFGVSRDTVVNWRDDERFDFIKVDESKTEDELAFIIRFMEVGGQYYYESFSRDAIKKQKKFKQKN